jgi:hypothetical protein
MRRFGPLDATALRQVLQDAATSRLTGSLTINGRGDGGQVWFSDGRVAYARTDEQPPLDRILHQVGAVADDGLSRLHASVDMAPALRPDISPAVEAVVHELTDEAMARLFSLAEGSWHVNTGDRPPLGLLTTRDVPTVLRAVATRDVITRARELQGRGEWRLRPTPTSRVKLGSREWAIVTAMARPASPAQVAHRVGMPIEEVRTGLSELSRQGLLERATPPPTTPATPWGGAPATPAPAPRATEPDRAERTLSTPAAELRVRPATIAEPAAVGAPNESPDAAWTARASHGGDRATALKRLIGAVRNL